MRYINVIIRPRESYTVAHPKIFVYCKFDIAELKLELSLSSFGLSI